MSLFLSVKLQLNDFSTDGMLDRVMFLKDLVSTFLLTNLAFITPLYFISLILLLFSSLLHFKIIKTKIFDRD